MKRKISVTFAAMALLGLGVSLPACKGGASAAAGKLIPEQATILVGVDVGRLMKTKLYVDNKAEFEKQSEYKEMAEAAKGCNLDPETAISAVTFGTDGKGNFVAVVTGEGIGNEANLTCIADKAKEKNNGKVPFTIADDGGKKVLRMDNEDSIGFITDAKTVVVTSKSWEAAVKDLIDGKGKPAMDGPNKDLFARADHSKHIWAAGLVPAEAAGGAAAMGGEPKDFSLSLDLSSGLGIKAAVGLANADQAKLLKQKADEALPGVKAMAPMFGVPAKAMDTVKVDVKDNQITFEASMSNEDIQALKDKAAGMLGAFGGGGGMGGPPMEPPAPPPVAPPPAPDDAPPAGE